jgi:phosphate transport system ATP-binding protein
VSSDIHSDLQSEERAPTAEPAAEHGPEHGLEALTLAVDASEVPEQQPAVLELKDVSVLYGGNAAIAGVNLEVPRSLVTAFIGPSGCGKSTLLRSLNRMNDLVSSARVEGEVLYHGQNLYGAGVDPVEVRRRIGMVFQRPNPFPKSIFDNVAYGLRALRMKDDLHGRVERALRRAALWDEVKDRLKRSALSLSGGEQQRLCIARALAVEPDVLLLDEPCSALDPISTARIEQLMHELRGEYSQVVVTHNMQQALRVADITAFFNLERSDDGIRAGRLIESGPTVQIFERPRDERTEGYVRGRFG